MKDYSTVFNSCIMQTTVKKSEFISFLFHIESEEEVQQRLEEVKKLHYKANHNCYAYIIGTDSRIKKFSDDGEPSGTAGRPILGVLEKNELTDVLGIVTRYFGGVNLGASGLSRAYAQSMAQCLVKAEKIKRIYCVKAMISADYSLFAKIEAFLLTSGCKITDRNFTQNAELCVLVPCEEYDRIKDMLIDITNGKCTLTEKERLYYSF